MSNYTQPRRLPPPSDRKTRSLRHSVTERESRRFWGSAKQSRYEDEFRVEEFTYEKGELAQWEVAFK